MKLGIIGAVLAVLAAGYAARDVVQDTTSFSPAQPSQAQIDAMLDTPVNVLVRTENHDYSNVTAVIENHGGEVTRTFKYARGLAATVPARALTKIRRADGVLGVGADEIRKLASFSPGDYDRSAKSRTIAKTLPGIQPLGGEISKINDLDRAIALGTAFDLKSKFKLGQNIRFDQSQLAALTAELTPDQYANPVAQNAVSVWAGGNFGQGTMVAVIDSGVYADHFLLEGRVPYCVDLSVDVGTEFEGCSRPDNNFHGTHVASTVAGNGAALLPAGNAISTAITRHMGPLVNASSLGFPGGKILPLNGIAPLSQIYGVKVFPANGGGAANSIIIAGIEHVIDQKLAGIDVDVINMSLGGGTTYDGVDLEDQAVDAATAAGITVVTSAGNEGPAYQTTGSPATAQSSIAVAAIAHPIHVRTFWDFNFFPSNSGHQLFVSDEPQIVAFSSRGGTADGRAKPQISAPGVFILAALISPEDPQGLGFSSGTSMASPGIAGTVALLNTASDVRGLGASPYDYLQALEAGADPLPGYGVLEQGAGANNAAAAMAALLGDNHLGEAFPPLPAPDPASPVVPEGTDLGIENGGSVTVQVNDLAPGLAQHYYVKTDRNTSRIAVDATGIRTKRDPFGINSFEVYVKTGTRTYQHYYAESINVFGNAHIEVTDLHSEATGAVGNADLVSHMLIQPGYTRITIENDWTSSGPMSGTFEITVEANGNPSGVASIPGSIADHDFVPVAPLPCPELACRLDITWVNDWTVYPTTDLDLVIFGIDDDFNLWELDLSAASLNAPESNNNPFFLFGGGDVGNVTQAFVFVDGFNTHGRIEDFVVDWWPAE